MSRRWMMPLGCLAVAVGSITAIGCSDSTTPEAPSPGSQAQSPPPADPGQAPPSLRLPVPQVPLEVVDRSDFDKIIQRHRGKVILVDFWANMVRPCMDQFPFMVALHEKHAGEGLVVISVCIDDPADEQPVRDFLGRHNAQFINLLSKHGPLGSLEAFEIDNGSVPTYWLYDRSGAVVERFSMQDANRPYLLQDIGKAVKQLLAGTPAESTSSKPSDPPKPSKPDKPKEKAGPTPPAGPEKPADPHNPDKPPKPNSAADTRP